MAETFAESAAPAAPSPVEYTPKKPVYCGVCTLPPEYCEFGGTTEKCSSWLLTHNPSLHAQLYSAEALATATASLSVDARKRAEKDSLKKAAKASAASARAEEKRLTSRITIKRVERNKRKFVTVISGLENFLEQGPRGLRPAPGTTVSESEVLKKVAKELGKRFACGSSVTRNAGGTGDEVTVQGDLSGEVEEWIEEGWEVPEENVVVEEVKGKKGAG